MRARDHVLTDLRMALPAVAAWATAALSVVLPPAVTIGACGAAAVGAVLAARSARPLAAVVGVLVAGVALVAGVRVGSTQAGVVADLGAHRVTASATMRVATDPRLVDTPGRRLVVFDATVRHVIARGQRVRVRAPVVVWADESAADLALGSTVEAVGRLGPADDSAHAASLQASSIRTTGDAAWWWSASARMRGSISAAVGAEDPDVRALVPALVHGDDSGLSDTVKEDFKDSGLTHLLAVSGTNLTLVVAFLLAVTRPIRLTGRGSIAVGAVATAAFVVLARPEPSVVRAAVMGLVALAGLGSGGRGRGVRCLAWAVVVLVLVDPWLSRSPGFVLSTVATAGILVLAPTWRDALARWLPRWCAEALAVPMAAQLVCTPVIAALSGKVSLVAVAANVLAGPAVGPATVLGLLAGAVHLATPTVGRGLGLLAGLLARWIITVGHHGAGLPGAAVESGSSARAVVVLAAGCVVVGLSIRRVLGRPAAACAAAVLSTVLVVRPPAVGWPPDGWVMVACNVGQGDATVLNAGAGRAVVVDAGPDPRAVDRCLRRLRVRQVPLVVLTHGHADHVDGLSGVLRGREVGEIEFGPGGAPVLPRGIAAREVAYGETRHIGALSWTVVSPESMRPVALDASNGEGSAANDASIVMTVRVRGVTIMMSGDIEPLAQARLLRTHPSLRADVLKVPHHGSARQDPAWFAALGARFGTLSAGEHNTFGHPAPKTIALMRSLGVTPLRTDTQGDVAIVVDDGRPGAFTAR